MNKNTHSCTDWIFECGTMCHLFEISSHQKLITKSESEKPNERISKIKQVNKKIKEYQNFIKSNFEYVGQNFAYEARSIHYNDKKKEKGIYGTASNKEVQELREEGIVADTIPWFKDKSN